MLQFYQRLGDTGQEESIYDIFLYDLTREQVDEIKDFISHMQNIHGYAIPKAGEIAERQNASHFSLDEFLTTLTLAEKKALDSLLKELKYSEGMISFSSLSEKSGLPRTAYTSLLNKLKTLNLIHARNSGVKGTYIKILEPALQEWR